MAAKILIKRQWLEGQAGEIFSLLNKLRTTARNQQGYITGETLQEHNNPQKTLVIGTWEHMQNWFPWKKNTERRQREAMLEIHQEGPTEYGEYVSVSK
ncbi:MAG: antibiotic biosynthesis monooxygenase [Desulfobacterales bacterium]|jgi:heme-degrading monooxygenase HmoA|nr:antibiotic biosynthesis monooxygenase [Desulfobacterales bacterium]